VLFFVRVEVYLKEEPQGKGIHRRPFQVGDLVVRRSRWVTCQSARYDRCIGYVSVTFFVLALSSDNGFLGFSCARVVFLLIEFPLR
jgi:hypothetical protein